MKYGGLIWIPIQAKVRDINGGSDGKVRLWWISS